jgi:hypothetical protein
MAADAAARGATGIEPFWERPSGVEGLAEVFREMWTLRASSAVGLAFQDGAQSFVDPRLPVVPVDLNSR